MEGAAARLPRLLGLVDGDGGPRRFDWAGPHNSRSIGTECSNSSKAGTRCCNPSWKYREGFVVIRSRSILYRDSVRVLPTSVNAESAKADSVHTIRAKKREFGSDRLSRCLPSTSFSLFSISYHRFRVANLGYHHHISRRMSRPPFSI